jgi:aminopeptidase-like protein
MRGSSGLAHASGSECAAMDALFDRLFPICRSITGPGLRETLHILAEYLPLERFSVPSGTCLFTWTVPQEWIIHSASLTDPDGGVVADFSDSNLHVVNYSTPVDTCLPLEELQEHLYTVPALPDATPYVTSYYTPRWGFCIPENRKKRLADNGLYHAVIESELVDGQMDYAHAILPGETSREVLLSTYVCHPSMANNELSGPLAGAFLYNRLKAWKNRKYTYRFVYVPETIGAVAYLHRFGEYLKEHLDAGMVLTCLGGDNTLSYKMSRDSVSLLDTLVERVFSEGIVDGRMRRFTATAGSDERQYCSPGFNLPVGQMARTLYHDYPEYHTSLDTKEFMKIESLQRSVDGIEKILWMHERCGRYENLNPYGEVKLDQFDLYPDYNDQGATGKSRKKAFTKAVQAVLNWSDGRHSLVDIAQKEDWPLLELMEAAGTLEDKGLLRALYPEKEE